MPNSVLLYHQKYFADILQRKLGLLLYLSRMSWHGEKDGLHLLSFHYPIKRGVVDTREEMRATFLLSLGESCMCLSRT